MDLKQDYFSNYVVPKCGKGFVVGEKAGFS